MPEHSQQSGANSIPLGIGGQSLVTNQLPRGEVCCTSIDADCAMLRRLKACHFKEITNLSSLVAKRFSNYQLQVC